MHSNFATMHVLLTNDDGIHAEGLHVLRKEIASIAEVTLIAPDRPRSACSHSITLHKPLRVQQVQLDDGKQGYICNGTPSDCVMLAVNELLATKPDLVIAGINLGPNLGDDVTYSGTVAAAMEGTILGIKSFAISVADSTATDFAPAASFARRFAIALQKIELPPGTFFNVDVPNLPAEMIEGYEFTRQGHHRYFGGCEKRVDPAGGIYYWRGGELQDEPDPEGTDVAAIANRRIAITPLQIDLTNHKFLEQLRNMKNFLE